MAVDKKSKNECLESFQVFEHRFIVNSTAVFVSSSVWRDFLLVICDLLH